jgi:acetylornithine deacetylase
MDNAISYTKELVRRASPSYQSNAEVSDYVQETLKRNGFHTERVEYRDAHGVLKVNVLGKKGPGSGGISFFGHTDTVPAEGWKFDDPFKPFEKDGKLYGRGACDMKGPVACALAAAEGFEASDLAKPIYIVCTADEEVGYAGATVVADKSELFQEVLQSAGIICEPTRLKVVYAHKGTVAITATATGRAAHSSTSEGINANLKTIPFLWEMKKIHDELQDEANWNREFDPPTAGWNIGINDNNGVLNITSPKSVATVYYRPMPGQDVDAVLERVRRCAQENDLELDLLYTGKPLYTDPNSELVRAVLDVAGDSAAHTVSYGTDGMVIGQHMPVVVIGPGDIAQAHTADEWIEIDQLEKGVELNRKLIQRFCC